MADRASDVTRIVTGGRAKGLSDDQIRALVARYDERQSQATSLPAEATAGMQPQSLTTDAPAQPPQRLGAMGIQTVSDEQWAGMTPNEKLGGLLTAAGKGLGVDVLFGKGSMDNPGRTLAGVVAGVVAPKVIEKTLAGVGKGAYRAGVALLPKTIKQQYPGIMQRGFQEGVALTKGGVDKANSLISASSQQADDMIAAAQQAGAAPVNPMDVVRELRPVGQRMANQTALGKPNAIPGLIDRAKSFLQRGPVPLTQAQALKREAQDLATSAYRAADRGATVNTMDTLTDEAMARGLRKAIEARVPGVGPVNTRTQELLGVLRGAEHASSTMHVLPRLVAATGAAGVTGGAGAIPAMAAGAAAGALATPGGMTATGVALKNAAPYSADWLRAILAASLTNQPEQ